MNNEVVELYRSKDDTVNEAIDRIVVKIHNLKKELNKKIILITGCSPSAGVTNTTLNLGISLAEAGWKTLIVDADLKKKKAYKKNAINIEVGLTEHLIGYTEIENIVTETNCEQLFYVSSGVRTDNSVRLLASAEMNNFIEKVGESFDYVLIDTPSINIIPDASILFSNIDGIILQASLNSTTKKQLHDARRQVMKYANKYYGLIVNNVDKNQFTQYYRGYDYFRDDAIAKGHEKKLRNAKRKNKRRENS